MEWYWWVIIGVSVLVVAVVIIMLMSGDEEEAAEEKVAEQHDTIDLNDPKVLKALSADGASVAVGETVYFQVGHAGEKGFSWIVNEDCDGILAVETLDGPPLKEEKAEEGDEKKDEEAEEKDEKKDEKKLRQDKDEEKDEKAEEGDEKKELDQIYMSATGEKAGNCTFAMTYAESWDGDLKSLEDDAKVISFDVAVTEAAAEEEEEAKEEK